MINEKIYIGSVDTPTISFDQDSIEDIICNNAVNLIGDELSSDTLEVSVFFDDVDEVLLNLAYGTTIFYYSNDYLVGKYYVSEIERKGIKRYLIRATSLIGLIEKEEFYGGFYTGERFDNVLNDILFTSGVSLIKYNIYKPIPIINNYVGAVVSDKTSSLQYPKYGVHLDFVFNGDFTTSAGGSASNIFGNDSSNGRYYVEFMSRGTSTPNPYGGVRIHYNGSTYSLGYKASDPKCGIGSKFVVDVNPLSATASIIVDRVDPDDATIQDHQERNWTITAFTATVAKNYSVAYGGIYNNSTISRNSAKLIWNSYQVFDENGIAYIDAMFATNEDDTKNYVANAASGYVVETTSFGKYGECLGIIGDFSRFERDIELMNSISYGLGIAELPVRGWIPHCNRREALHQLLFSENVCLLKTDDGKFLFTSISDANSSTVPDSNIYDDSKEKSLNGAKKINITENSYETGGTSKVIFDNSSSTVIEGQYIALFDDAPIYGNLTSDGITIVTNNCNAAVVTGRGTIIGTPYVHSKNVIEYANSGVPDGTDISVSNIGLITSFNSDNIMNKLKSYYSGNLTQITNSLIYAGEKCGVKYSFKTLYKELNSAFLTNFSARSSSFVKALCTFISGYVPPGTGGYTGFAIETYGDIWTVPQDVRSKEYPNIRLNIIGKGHDGTSGSNGSYGNRGRNGEGILPGGTGGEGGTAGVGGEGGNIYSLTIDVASINTISVSNSGYNTIVRTYNDNGTLINTYSSSSGLPSSFGFMNVFTGIYYARSGKDGIPGGDGGQGGYVVSQGIGTVDTVKGANGEDAGDYSGGESFNCIIRSAYTETSSIYYYNSYGGGGGAAYGNNGGNAFVNSTPSYETPETSGGHGANAITPDNVYTEYGSGGFGGHGGGGGGGAGTVTYETTDEYGMATYYTYYYLVGNYGTGSSGTPGINGCAIIYY